MFKIYWFGLFGFTFVLLACAEKTPCPTKPVPMFGTLLSDSRYARENHRAGIRLATVSLAWGRYVPRKEQVDERYLAEIKSRIKAFREAGLQIILDLGMHYPPSWVFQIPHSRFVNQYGDPFIIVNKPGLNVVNAVFNQTVREQQMAYVDRVFNDLGTDFFAVRIGWGPYSELHYPWKGYKGKQNCYWGFDPIAQGKTNGLPPNMKPCPVPGWLPGTPSNHHESARLFLNWYLDSLAQFQNFQITTLRRHYQGRIIVPYANWGIRPGQIAEAVTGDLNGTSFAERYEQTHKGYDFARLIGAINDTNVVVYSTCVNAMAPWPCTVSMVDDDGDDPSKWSPIHYLASCAAQHRPPLTVAGENDGNDNLEAMQISFRRLQAYDLKFFVWAFDFQLHDKQRRYATIADYQRCIAQFRAN